MRALQRDDGAAERVVDDEQREAGVAGLVMRRKALGRVDELDTGVGEQLRVGWHGEAPEKRIYVLSRRRQNRSSAKARTTIGALPKRT